MVISLDYSTQSTKFVACLIIHQSPLHFLSSEIIMMMSFVAYLIIHHQFCLWTEVTILLSLCIGQEGPCGKNRYLLPF